MQIVSKTSKSPTPGCFHRNRMIFKKIAEGTRPDSVPTLADPDTLQLKYTGC